MHPRFADRVHTMDPVMAPPPPPPDGRWDDNDDDPDDDGSGNDNRMIPAFRGMMKKYGAGLVVCSVGFLAILIIEAAAQWNVRPSWIKKVPCVLQPKLARIESTLKGIERYFLLSGMVPPVATCVFILLHLLSSRARTDRDYEPPAARWMVLIWSWKILTPLIGAGPAARRAFFFAAPAGGARVLTRRARAVYVFIQVKADEFVGYEAMAQKLCEVSLSLTLYPPGMNAPPVRFTALVRCTLSRRARARLEAAVLAGLGRDGPWWGLANICET